MDKAQLKQRVCEAIEARRCDIEALANAIAQEPELGFKEQKTSQKVKKAFEALGMDCTDGWGITGVKARLKGKKSLRTVALLGELDAVICREHPQADSTTGAAHSCGHNVQIANMMAVAMAFKDAGIMDQLDGDVVFFAVPAEEYVEIDYRNKLRCEGQIRYLGGKQEIIGQGGFDDVDMALQMHTNVTSNPNGYFGLGASSNGFIGKLIEYRGVPAHAACAPDQGVNALNAAMMGVMGVNAIRETFRDEDCVRFHPIINSGGDLVNVIPDHVTMESYVRAANLEALKRYNAAINRALKAGGDALGAQCTVHDLPGYLPLRPDADFRDVMRVNAEAVFGAENVGLEAHSAGSTDMGDVSHLIPVVHPWVGCAEGVLHGANYRLTNPEVAYEKVAKVLAMTIIDLLFDDAAKAEAICQNFKPILNRQTYCEFMDSVK
ncbi:MAG: amidohydrolase [Burkholderiaceae bacterium]|nr:amidohydrolase [Burkholderiaceae bacterium]